MKFKPYPKYKTSGVEWLGDVPESWDVASLKHGFKIVGGSTPKSEKPEYWDGEIIWVSPSDLSKLSSIGIKSSQRKITAEGLASCGTTLVPAGSVVLSTRAPIGSLAIAETELCTNQGCKSLVPNQNSDPLFYGHLLSISTVELNVRGKGTTFLELSTDELGAFKVGVPPRNEQSAIATFLDRETAKIDTLITKQEKLIDLLKEKRQAVISHAVTKGLDPTAPMKPSGVEWLGDVPERWTQCGIKHLMLMVTDGAHISPETENGTYHFVSTKDVKDYGIDFTGSLLTSSISYESLVRSGCRPNMGDVLFSKDGTIGKTVVVAEEREFVVASSLIILRPNPRVLDSEFFNYSCQSLCIQEQVNSFVKGAGLPRLSIQNLLKVWSVFPPITEQKAIASRLQISTKKIDTLIAKAQQAIALQKEHRIALISAAVTGKIDVRSEVEVRKAA